MYKITLKIYDLRNYTDFPGTLFLCPGISGYGMNKSGYGYGFWYEWVWACNINRGYEWRR